MRMSPPRWARRVVVAVAFAVFLLYRMSYPSNPHSSPPTANIPGVEAPPPVTKVILFTYKRSGSTFLGELFQQNTGCWYFFEPLAFFSSRINGEKQFFWSDTEKPYSDLRPTLGEYMKYLNEILSCKFEYPNLLEYYRSGVEGIDDPDRFFHPALFVRLSGRLHQALMRPVRPLRDWCLDHPIRVAKTIRLVHLQAVLDLADNDTRVVHLVRDPRAIAVSRKTNQTTPASVCGRMAENLRVGKQRRGRVVLVKYEDLATSTQQLAAGIYHTLGLRMPKRVADWIDTFTKAGASSDRAYDPEKEGSVSLSLKRNSSATAWHWVRDIEPETARRFDQDRDCQFVYRLMGYQPYDQLVNRSNLRLPPGS